MSTNSKPHSCSDFQDLDRRRFIKTVGSGTLEYVGFFPGLAYQKGGVLTMKAV